jgi:predicted flap endonuclease-1-like 5' DNA nuclease
MAEVATAESVPTAGTDSPALPSLRSIKGIGDVAQQRLADAGVTSVDQVAAWTDADIDRVAAQMRASADRIRREDWVGQARSLQTGR